MLLLYSARIMCWPLVPGDTGRQIARQARTIVIPQPVHIAPLPLLDRLRTGGSVQIQLLTAAQPGF